MGETPDIPVIFRDFLEFIAGDPIYYLTPEIIGVRPRISGDLCWLCLPVAHTAVDDKIFSIFSFMQKTYLLIAKAVHIPSILVQLLIGAHYEM